ncbi:MAG: methyltransferase domain-containing protein [Bacteroidales bacterium]|nr:methyltransferase domain-containing protein [Bacteroidales bacterium]
MKKSKGLHLGLWHPDTKSLHEAIQNTNEKIAGFIPVKKDIRVLDAGCGVGGTAIYLAKNYRCQAKGITLSKLQISQGKDYIREAGLEGQVRLSLQDYTSTSFTDGSFDLVYAIESICHASEKADVYKEAFRLLKPGGKLVVIDYFSTEKGQRPENRKLLEWWLHLWAVSALDDDYQTQKKIKADGIWFHSG